MSNYIISTCSPCDLSAERLAERDVSCLLFRYTLGGKEMIDDFGKTLSFDEFYKAMADGAETRTAQANQAEYCEYFSKLLSSGKDVLHLCLSSGLTGTYNSAVMAQRELKEKFPNQKLYVVDSLAASGGLGFMVDALCDLRRDGKSIDECFEWAEQNKLKMHHWFFSTDLSAYVRGGRLSRVSGWFGTLLKICPLLNMDGNGKLMPRSKIRGNKTVIKAIVDKMIDHADDGVNYSGKVFISNSACPDDANAVAELVRQTFSNAKEIIISSIGATIGCHTGGGTVALFFWGEKRS